ATSRPVRPAISSQVRIRVLMSESLLSTERLSLTISRRSLPPFRAGAPGPTSCGRTDERHPFGDTAPRRLVFYRSRRHTRGDLHASRAHRAHRASGPDSRLRGVPEARLAVGAP